MVLEQFLDKRIVVQHFSFVFLLSAFYVLVAYAVQWVFFPQQSLATVLLVAVLLVPSIHHLIIIEEAVERKGSSHFWKRHRMLIRSLFGAFFGLLTGFLVLGSLFPSSLAYQRQELEHQHLRPELITAFELYQPEAGTALSLFAHNLQYLLIGFFLSIFYGAGATFLLIYHASFFSTFILSLFERWPSALQLSAISLSHLIPETAGFILTAIAGATLSRAFVREKLGSQPFKNVLRNCFLLLFFAVLSILAAAIIETYLTAPAFRALIAQ